MEHDFWHQRWHLKEIGFHQQAVNTHLARFWRTLDAGPSGRVFVPLCGKSRDMLWLRQQGWEVIGVELSPIAVEEFFSEAALAANVSEAGDFVRYSADGIEILCGDFFQLTPEHLAGVTAVYDRASLVALPPAMRADYADLLSRLLPSDAPILLVAFDYAQDEMAGPPFSVSEEEIRQLYRGYRIECLHREDLLAGPESTRWRDRGISRLAECVLMLTPLGPKPL